MNHKFQITALSVLAVVVLAILLFRATSVQAQPSAQATTTATATAPAMNDNNAAAKYCSDKGGTVTTRYPAYNTNASQDLWLMLAGSRDFCTFHEAPDATGFQSQISIALDTLYADQPTLAMLAYLEPVALPPFTGANPSTLYCAKLGGSDIWGGQNNAAGGGWVTKEADSKTNFQVVSMCMFPDGSAIDSWGLTYKANGVVRGADLSQVARWQPTTLPDVFVGASSPNQPAESSVDKTLINSDNTSNVTLKVDDTLTVKLASNPSTGYSWHVMANDEKVLQQVGEPQFDIGNETPIPGAGGTQMFTFNAIGKGTTKLTLVYVRPWEKDTTPTPQNTWSVNVTVQ